MQKVLIVEDEIIIAEGIKLYLEKNGFVPVIATSGKKAMELLESRCFDAMICDINLQEEMNGIDLVRQYHEPGDHGPVVFLTAYSNTEVMESAESLLPYAYILKPFHNKQLLTTLNLAIANTNKDGTPDVKMGSEKLENLSKREKEILEQLAYGKTNREIGERLHISKYTVDTHIRNIKEKLDLHKKGELIKFVLLNNA
jgi:DNA-binding NarL/FixJ family response regulator